MYRDWRKHKILVFQFTFQSVTSCAQRGSWDIICPVLRNTQVKISERGRGGLVVRQAGTWDLGPFAAVLPHLHLDKRLLQQQNTKKLYGTKNNCVRAQLEQILDQKIQKDKKKKKTTTNNPTATSEQPGAKTGCWEQKQGTAHASCPQHHQKGGKPPKPAVQPDPWTHAYPHPK